MKVSSVKILRVSKGFSQSELAERAGVTRQTIAAIESGEYNPTLQLCIRICLVLDTTLDALFWNEFYCGDIKAKFIGGAK